MNPDNNSAKTPAEPVSPVVSASNVPTSENIPTSSAPNMNTGTLEFQSYSSKQRKHLKKPIVMIASLAFVIIVIALFVYFAWNYYQKQTETLNTPHSTASP